MKINPDHLSALRPDAERDVHKAGKTGERFEDLLSRAAEKVVSTLREQSSTPSGQLPGAGSAMHLTATQLLFSPEKFPECETKAMDVIDNLLSQWENYADQLAATPQGLRKAHDILSQIFSEIGQLKANWLQDSAPAGPGPGLKSMLDELEVLAVTERIKFDRGDYI